MPHEVLLLASTDGGDQLTTPITGVQNKLTVVPYYWDPVGLTYVVAQQAGGGTGGGGDASAANQTTEIAKLTSIDGKTPALGQALAAASVPVVLPASQLSTLTPLSSVSVSNFPATQPVSGTVALDAPSLAALETISVANFPATQAVTGTFFQATQPVSLASVPSHAVTNAGVFAVQPEMQNRVHCSLYAEAVAGVIAETAITMSKSLGFATVTTGTSLGPTSGKNFRIVMLLVSWVSTSTTANTCRIRLRVNPSGAATTTSPIQLTARIAWESATFIANEGEFQQIPIPDGFDIPSGAQGMWTLSCVAANGTLDINALGYEYTP